MKLAYPALSELVLIERGHVSCLVIENRRLFRSLIFDFSAAIDGSETDLVLSENEKILEISKYGELLTDFISFDPNRKTLLNKVLSRLEQISVSGEHYVRTQELLADIENLIGEWAFSFPCDIFPQKLSVSTLLKAVGIQLRMDYDGHIGEVEKILDYMELVREFDRDKLFVTVNMRAFFEDAVIEQFQKTVLSHEFHVLMLESQAYPLLTYEKRTTIDADLCVF